MPARITATSVSREHMECTVEYDGLRHRWVGTRRWAKSPIRDEQFLLHLSHGQTVPVVSMTWGPISKISYDNRTIILR